MTKYVVLIGSYLKGKMMLKKGGVFESGRNMLRIQPGKFGLAAKDAKTTKGTPLGQVDAEADELKKKLEALGADVTEQFAEATIADLKVFQSSKGYQVVDPETAAVLNPKPFKKAEQAVKFIKAYSPED